MDSVPANSCILLNDQREAQRYPCGRIQLGFCPRCGFIGNLAFDVNMARYTNAYEEQQSFSPRFNAFARDLVQRLIARHGLRNKTVLEIGCGKGDFLALLCELGPNRGVGIDPTYIPGRQDGAAPLSITFIQDFYSERYAHLAADFVCCRHTLEHIFDTASFVRTVRNALGARTGAIVFFEVPDVLRVLREPAFWDIYYEHCSYFSPGSLARLFRSSGFEVLDLALEYDGQYLLLEARPVESGLSGGRLELEDTPEVLRDAVARFQETCANAIRAWRRRIQAARTGGKSIAIWGSGSKCVAFLATLGIADDIGAVVDINPYRHGKYLPGTGKPIVPPAALKETRPDLVIAMNPIYLEEIRSDLAAMDLHPELIAV